MADHEFVAGPDGLCATCTLPPRAHDDAVLYDGLPPHVRDSDTSLDAAVSVRETTGRLRARVLAYIREHPEGVTCDDAEAALDLRHQTCSARVRELVLLGLVHDTGLRARTRSGRRARVYREIRIIDEEEFHE